jgi:general secretion pathway protein G
MQKQFAALRTARKNHENGFTLIELLIVVLILGILAAIVMFAVGSFTSTSAVAACNTDAKTVETAISAYDATNGTYPPAQTTTSNAALTADPSTGGPYLRSFPSSSYYQISTDSSGNVYVALPAAGGGWGKPADYDTNNLCNEISGSSTTTTSPAPLATTYASVTAEDSPAFGQTAASVTASGSPSTPNFNMLPAWAEFEFGPPDALVVYTAPTGQTYGAAGLAAAMNTAVDSSGQPLDAIVTISAVPGVSDQLQATATNVGSGWKWNGWEFWDAPNNNLLESTGFVAGQALSGGGTAIPLVMTAGVNDEFEFGVPGAEVTYTVAPGSYATVAAVGAAMTAAKNSVGDALGAVVNVTADSAKSDNNLIATAVGAGSTYNRQDFLSGVDDFLAASGFVSGQTLAGGA